MSKLTSAVDRNTPGAPPAKAETRFWHRTTTPLARSCGFSLYDWASLSRVPNPPHFPSKGTTAVPEWMTYLSSPQSQSLFGCVFLQARVRELPHKKDGSTLRQNKKLRTVEPIAIRMEAITTRNKNLLGTKGIATRSKDATRGSWPYYWEQEATGNNH